MNFVTTEAAVRTPAAPFDLPSTDRSDRAENIFQAASHLLPLIERGKPVDARDLRAAMMQAFNGTDAEGLWAWKDAYEAVEAAQIRFLQKFGPAIAAQSGSPQAMLAMLAKVAGLVPTHTRRSQESQALQQLSTPLPLAFAAAHAAALNADDHLLEPSAGIGMLAAFGGIVQARLALNEFADTRAKLLGRLFPGSPVTRHDAAHIDDHLDVQVEPSVILMNPPFSVGAHVEGRVSDAAWRHLSSAFARLGSGGRLVAITGANLSPDQPKWRDAFTRLQEQGKILFTAAIDGRVYARHGTMTATRLTVIDKNPAPDPSNFVASRGIAPDVHTLLDWLGALPPCSPSTSPNSIGALSSSIVRDVAAKLTARKRGSMPRPAATAPARSPSLPISPSTLVETSEAIELSYELRDWVSEDGSRITDAIYEPYSLQSIHIPGAKPHPTKLVQSAAMAAVAPPKPSYRPLLPAAVIDDGLLSDAQLESVIYAGEAHSGHLAGSWTVDKTFDVVSAAAEGAENAVRFRRGWFLGDGTGAGKGRPVAGILLDNWQQGRRRAVWISKSDKLLEDAQRDWSALGQEKLLVQPLSRFRQGTAIRLAEGILYTTYATLRSQEREGKKSRVQQIIDWLGQEAGSGEAATGWKKTFDGVMLDDGTIERRVRLVRPTDEIRFGLDALTETFWQPADRKTFAEHWQAEAASLPEYSQYTFHIVTGLLLPIWRRLPDDDCRVYRLQTDEGERIIGRYISPALVATLYRNLGLDHAPSLSGDDAWRALVDGRISLRLDDGLSLRRVRVMNGQRVELAGFTDAMTDRLKAMGLMSEIIAWQLRMFIPTGADGLAILGRLIDRHPIVGVADRSSAA